MSIAEWTWCTTETGASWNTTLWWRRAPTLARSPLLFRARAASASIRQGTSCWLQTGARVVQRKPRVWQPIGETKKEIAARYAIRTKNEVGFELDHYDAGAALVIDPVLVYSTFLDGLNRAAGAVDGAGNVYLSGSNGGRGTFVKKLDPSGTNVIYSTYIGGANYSAIALDATGNVYVTGFAYTPDFPATPGAFQTQIAGTGAPFIAKVNATGTSLVYATFLSPSDGASLSDDSSFTSPCCIAVDSAGSAYVTGTTRSKNFPTTPGAFQAHWDAGWSTFVTKLNPTGTALAYSTYLGGSGSGALLFGMSQAGHGNCSGYRAAMLTYQVGRVRTTSPPHRALFSFRVRPPTAAS